MSCSDKQMIIASQLAYVDFNSAAVDSGLYTVKELLEMELESGSGQKDTINHILDLMNDNGPGRECADWVLKDICNDQRRSGMYACMLDTGDGGAMIAFRGSEDMGNVDNLMKDWIGSDLGLLNSTLTPQQAVAEQYVSRLYKMYGNEYDSFSMTGHSLGGNLAEHASITAPDSMREKIDRCVNLDGPGFSTAYLTAHANDIQKSEGLIDHYQWSAIGTLLNTVPGTNYQTVEAETPTDKGALNIIWRHDTKNVKEFDEDGNVIPGEKDWLSRYTKQISSALDLGLCLYMGNLGLALMYNFLDVAIDEIRNLKERWQEQFTQSGRAEFTVCPKALYESMDQLQSAADIIRSVQMETACIRQNLPINSLSAGYIKYKLWRMENSVGSLADHMQGFASAGEDCVNTYQKYDSMIAAKY